MSPPWVISWAIPQWSTPWWAGTSTWTSAVMVRMNVILSGRPSRPIHCPLAFAVVAANILNGTSTPTTAQSTIPVPPSVTVYGTMPLWSGTPRRRPSSTIMTVKLYATVETAAGKQSPCGPGRLQHRHPPCGRWQSQLGRLSGRHRHLQRGIDR